MRVFALSVLLKVLLDNNQFCTLEKWCSLCLNLFLFLFFSLALRAYQLQPNWIE